MRKGVNAETARLAECNVGGMQEKPQNRTVSIRLPTAEGAQSSRPGPRPILQVAILRINR
jgi:hypothetical protein